MVKESASKDNKKKRKTAPAETEAEADIYKKVVEFEQKEAVSRDADKDSKIYVKICEDIRKLSAEIFDLKGQNNSENLPAISEKCMQACVKIAVLKKLNRMEKVRLVAAKEALNVEKQKVDSINLQYQNLLYEANHLISEFNKCFQFKSKDEDIDLIPIQEFLDTAPEEITKKFKNADFNDETTKHELRLARLEFELHQRKDLSQLSKTLEEEKKKLGGDIVERKQKLDGLAPKLNAVLEATLPLQEHLNMPIEKTRNYHKMAMLLPDPLYLFYVNVDAYKQVNADMNLNVSIIGDKDEATQWKNQQNARSLQEEEDSEQENEQESEEVVETKKRRHRKSTTKVDPKEEKKKKLLETHPLTLDVSITLKDGLCLKMKFMYYTNLKIITVTSNVTLPEKITGNTAKEVLMGDNLLGELIVGDLGIESPNPSNSYQLKKVGVESFHSLVTSCGNAYSWAQRVCGLDFLPEENTKTPVHKISQVNVEKIMKILHKRLQARYALATQLQQLEQNIIPVVPNYVDVPRNAISSLTKWTTKSYQQFCQSKHNDLLIDEEIVVPSDIFYMATITRSNAHLEMYIIIKNDFPIQTPIFSLLLNYNGKHHSGNSDQIRDIERSLNIEWDSGFSCADWILAAQILHACSFLDVYLETEHPDTFPQNTMFFRSVCARNRRRPFKFRKIGSGVFTQY